MQIIKFSQIPFIAASHEDKKNPGVFKKILFTSKNINPKTRIQMVNWAVMPVNKKFQAHYHEDMDEIFIILSGTAEIVIEKEKDILKTGDNVYIPMKKTHFMKNIGSVDVKYIVIGLSLGRKGKTIIVYS